MIHSRSFPHPLCPIILPTKSELDLTFRGGDNSPGGCLLAQLARLVGAGQLMGPRSSLHYLQGPQEPEG